MHPASTEQGWWVHLAICTKNVYAALAAAASAAAAAAVLGLAATLCH